MRWIDGVAPYATLLLTIGLFATAVAQWRAADRQAATAEALQRLEYARSAARFAFSSTGVIPFGPASAPRLIEVPGEIYVKPLGGVGSILSLDAEALLVLSEVGSSSICRAFVRGLYELEGQDLVLREDSREDFKALVERLAESGFELGVPSYNVMITYTDVFGDFRIKSYHVDPSGAAEIEATRPSSLIMYSRRWSSGAGYYFDEPGTPQRNCPKIAHRLEAALAAAGGHPPTPAEVDQTLDELIKRRGLEIPGVTN